MEEAWLLWIFEWSMTLLVLVSTAFTVFIFTLPKAYDHFNPVEITNGYFTDEDKADPIASGYSQFLKHKDKKGVWEIKASVQVVVLGDIGRSPRMQNHALSIASRGGKVNLIGYAESDIHPDIRASRLITIVPIRPFPKFLQTSNKILFLALAPLKVTWQTWFLYYALAYRSEATNWMLVQNPPSIPMLIVAHWTCFFRSTQLVIDWHNFGYSILAQKLGRNHPLVWLSYRYEKYFARGARAHFAVSNAMQKSLKDNWNVEAKTLYDRPPKHFQLLTSEQRSALLYSLPETSEHAEDIEKRAWRLVVSSTSWTSDEDFSLFLDALVEYSASIAGDKGLPKILAIITGKGPQKEHYIFRIRQLNQENKLQNVIIKTAWLNTKDYASLLGSADLGVSLHTSSSGVDLPMKVVDMFGTGLPVAGWSGFEAWPELVQEGKNGCGFDNAEGLAKVLEGLFGGDGRKLEQLKEGAMKECDRRWDEEWMPVAGDLFRLKP